MTDNYVLCYRRPPFYAHSSLDVYQKIIQGQYEMQDDVNTEIQDLIRRLLTVCDQHRLGCSNQGVQEIKNWPWFKPVIWSLVSKKTVMPPWVPSEQKGFSFTNHFKLKETDCVEKSLPISE